MKKYVFAITILACMYACKKDTTTTPATPVTPPVVVGPSNAVKAVEFKGVNWADTRDNFADDALLISGLYATDTYAKVQSTADVVLTAFANEGANTVRLPVNPSTVISNWWASYKGAVDKASSKNMKVLLAYWEGASSKDGRVDNPTTFYQMWDTVVANYTSNANIYFEIFNEPHGYSADELKTLYTQWISRYPGVPKNRIVLDGVGYASDVNTIGSSFDSCFLSFHDYTWFETSRQTIADWEVPVTQLNYPTRTVVTEFGTTMTDGTDYTGAAASNVDNTYLQGMTNSMHAVGVGGIYWPGLRTGDTYSMFTLNGTTVATNNASGLTRLKYAWGIGNLMPTYASLDASAYYKIINKNSEKALDVNNSSTDNGGTVIQWDYSGGNNQQWSFALLDSGFFNITNKNSNKVIDVNASSATAGSGIVQWDASVNASQQWQVIDIGFGYYKIINRNSRLSLDVNGQSTVNGGNVIQWNVNNGANQQWQIIKL